MFCEDCGHTLKPEAKFCSKCGASQVTSQTDVYQDQLKSTRDDLVEKVQTLQAEESIHNLEEGKVYAGNPAKVLNSNSSFTLFGISEN